MINSEENDLEKCQAVMIGFNSRRFVIVRRDGSTPLRLCDGPRKRVRDLQPGDKVIYKGQLHVVKTLQIY